MQARHDLAKAEENLTGRDFAYACFFAEQSAQKSLKAFLISQGRRFITTHSVGELAKEAAGFDKSFEALIDGAKRLDRHYLSSRYPDALPEPAIPAESYVKEEAEEALAVARGIFEAARREIAS